jgi:hypothetical protein
LISTVAIGAAGYRSRGRRVRASDGRGRQAAGEQRGLHVVLDEVAGRQAGDVEDALDGVAGANDVENPVLLPQPPAAAEDRRDSGRVEEAARLKVEDDIS